MQYRLNKNVIEELSDSTTLQDGDILLEILTTEEYREVQSRIPHSKVVSRNIDHVEYCKAELLDKGIVGTLLIPVKEDILHHEISLTYYMEDHHFIFIDTGHNLTHAMNTVRETELSSNASVGFFFCELLQTFISDDVIWLQQYEKHLVEMEEEILDSKSNQLDINRKILYIRKEMLTMTTYYQQLSDMTELSAPHAYPIMILISLIIIILEIIYFKKKNFFD